MKASAYPFNASAGISPTESSLLNNLKAGLLWYNTPRNDDLVIQSEQDLQKSQNVTTLLPYYLRVLVPSKKVAFTISEVLITLGIIGVVAAMTLPTLVQNYQKRVVETRLQKFYSNINQAVQLTEVQYGDKKIWFEDLLGAELDENGTPVEGTSESEKWFNKYLAPHLKIIKQETLYDGSFIVYFPDGSALRSRSHTTRDWLFIPSNAKKCIETYGTEAGFGICQFMFNFNPDNKTNAWRYHYNKGFEPFKVSWNGSEEHLMEGCKGTVSASIRQGVYCTALIQHNGWKIPDDYPLKVSY